MKQPAITLKQLNCLIAVEDEAHFRRAAERCGVSQPSLSAQIQNLEEVLNIRLVERSRSGVSLTPIGREIADRARRISDEAIGIVDLAAGAQRGLVGTIRLGTSPTLGPYLLPHVVAALHKEHKELNLYVRETPARDLEHELARGLHDVVLTQMPVMSSEHVAFEVFREPLYLAFAVDHPLAERETITVDALKDLEVLSLSPNYHLHDQVKDLCDAFGATLLRDYEGTSLDALRQMAGMGMGVTFLPALYVHSEIKARSEVVIREVTGRVITRTIGLVWRKSAGKATSYRTIGGVVRDIVGRKFKDITLLENTMTKTVR
ncbi:MAG: hydrogen peroxide-inducible genes activator [Pseudomonadota bacterium]